MCMLSFRPKGEIPLSEEEISHPDEKSGFEMTNPSINIYSE